MKQPPEIKTNIWVIPWWGSALLILIAIFLVTEVFTAVHFILKFW